MYLTFDLLIKMTECNGEVYSEEVNSDFFFVYLLLVLLIFNGTIYLHVICDLS